MTPEFPPNNPRAELEVRLTAFILGELPAHDAAALRQTIDDDPQLAALYDRLSAAHKLVREAVASPAEPAKESAAPLRLSEARRQKLFAQFKTVAPKEFAPKKKPVISRRLLEIAAVVAIVGLLSGVLLWNLSVSPHVGENLQYSENSSRLAVASPREPAGTPLRVSNGVFNYTKTAASVPAPAAVTQEARIVENQSHDFELFDSQKPSQPRGKSPQAVSPTSPPAKTTIVLPPMDNSGNGDVALTWNTHDGSTQPPVVLGNVPAAGAQSSSGGTGGASGSPFGFFSRFSSVNGNAVGEDLSSAQNKGANPQGTSETRVFALKNADPKEVSALVTSLIPEGSTITANESGGSMTITADKEQMAQINSIVDSLDQDSRRKQQVHYYALNSADVQDVQRVMQDLFPSNNTGTRSSQNATAFGGAGGPAPMMTRSQTFAGANSYTVTNSISTSPESLGLAANNNWRGQTNDPEWIGFLEHPDQRHSASNNFLGRGAFVAIPQNNSLDANSIHNQTRLATLQNDGSLDDSFQPGQNGAEFRFYHDSNGNGVADTNGTPLQNPDAAPVYRNQGITQAPSSVSASLRGFYDDANGNGALSTNSPPPNVNIAAKFADITQPDNRALDNFDLGPNVVASGGTQPSLNKSDGFNLNSVAVNSNGKFPGAQTFANATTTFDDAAKYRQLTQLDNSVALKPADRSADFAQPNYVTTNGVLEVLTAPEVTTESGRTAKIESTEIATIVSPRAAGSRGSSMRQDASVAADDGRNFTYTVVDGKLVPTPAPNNVFEFSSGKVPVVTGTYFGGINGQAASQYAYVPADKVPRPEVATEGGRVSKAESPRATESKPAFSGIGAIYNGVIQNPQPFVETTPSSSYAAVQSGVVVRQPAGIGSSPKGEFPGAAADRAEQFAHLPAAPRLDSFEVTDSGGAAKEESERKLREQLLNVPTREVLIDSKLVEQKQLADATRRAETDATHALVEVEKAWDVEQRNGKFEPRPIAKPAEASQEFAANSGNLGGSRELVPVRTLNAAELSSGQPQPASKPANGWTTKVHTNAGSIGVADGSVQQVTVSGVRSFANHTGDSGPQPTASVDDYALGVDKPVAKSLPATNPASGQANLPDSNNVYSVQVVGYINLNTNGLNIVANQSDVEGDGKKGAVSSLASTSTNDPFFSNGQRTSVFNDRLKAPGLKSATAQPTSGVSTFTNGGKMNLAYAAQVATDEAVRREPDTVRLHRLNDEIKRQEDKVDGLRKELNLVDTDPQSTQPGSSLGPVNVLHYNSLKIDAETQYVKQAELLAKLKTLDKEELKQAIPTVAPDSVLAQLEQDQAATESLLKKLKNDLGPNHPDVQRTEKLLAENNKQIDSRVKGIVEGIEISVKSLKAQAQSSEDKLNEARTNDISIASETRPYYEARENLKRLVAARDQLAREANPQSQVPTQYAKSSDISDALKTLGANKANDGHSQAYREKKAELDRLKKFQEIMALRVAQESTDLKMPTTEMVETIEHADGKPSLNPGLGQRIGRMFTGKETQTARIKIERDVTDVPASSGRSDMTGVYDPYFVQTEFEVIQSAKVLDQVIDKLKLDQAWAAQKGSTIPLTRSETRALLKKNLELASVKNTGLVDIKVKSDKPEEAAKIANSIAEAYNDYRKRQREDLIEGGMKAAKTELAEQQKKIAQVEQELAELGKGEKVVDEDVPAAKHSTNAPVPQPDVSTAENAFSTFSLNISDVSLKLAAASLEKGRMPDASSIRSEEFINAFDYRDPEPAPGAPLGFAWERAQYSFAHNRDLLRFAVKTAATGREPGRPLNIVLLLDKSGSMERADRVRIVHEALRVLATQLQPQDKISVVTFARVARLWVDGLSGSQAAEVADGLDQLTPEGGTNLEEAMRLAYETARRHYMPNGVNRVVLLTDGAANLGNVDPDALKVKVEEHRKEGIALDCFGVGWEGYNDDLLEVISRNGGGRYGFINTPEEAATDFVGQLAGALNVAAYDVKVQVEFNPKRVTNWRQIGYAKHQLTKEQFRDNTVKAAQIAAAESGNGLYAIEVNPNGEGPIATVRVRYRVPGTEDYPEHEYQVPYTGGVLPLEQSSPAMRLMGSASAFSEWLASSPFAEEVTTDKLLSLMSGVPETYGADERPKKLEWMIRQAKSLQGK